MTSSAILILNERLKAISTLLFNLAGALIVATVARIWTEGTVGLASLAWVTTAFVIVFAGYKTPYLLEADG